MTPERSSKKGAVPLLSKRRLWQGAWLFVPGALAVLFSVPIGSLLKLETWIVAAAGGLALPLGVYWSASGTICPRCRLNLLWHAMTRAKDADWFSWVIDARSCPRCGYPESNRSEGAAG